MAKAKAKLEWLGAARDTLNQDPAFRKLGSTDLVFGLALGDETRLVRFEAFEITGIERDVDLRDAALVLRMNPKDWNAYLRQRSRGRGPSLMALDLDEQVFEAPNPLARQLLPRYNLTLQAFVDTGARLAE